VSSRIEAERTKQTLIKSRKRKGQAKEKGGNEAPIQWPPKRQHHKSPPKPTDQLASRWSRADFSPSTTIPRLYHSSAILLPPCWSPVPTLISTLISLLYSQRPIKRRFFIHPTFRLRRDLVLLECLPALHMAVLHSISLSLLARIPDPRMMLLIRRPAWSTVEDLLCMQWTLSQLTNFGLIIPT